MAVGLISSAPYSGFTSGSPASAITPMGSGGGYYGGGGGGGGGGAAVQAAMANQGWITKPWLDWGMYENPTLDWQKQQFQQTLASKNQHWDQVFGMLSGLAGQGGQMARAGGESGTGPSISAAPIYNNQQIEQGVNALRGKADAETETRVRGMEASAGGRGFGSNSPMLQAMRNSAFNANTATKVDAERNFRQQAASDNASQILKGQTAQEQQFASRQREDIERRRPYFEQTNALIAALAGLA